LARKPSRRHRAMRCGVSYNPRMDSAATRSR
jgi:hypothetical protein